MKPAPPAAHPGDPRARLVRRWLRRVLLYGGTAAAGYTLLGAALAWAFLHPPRTHGRGTPGDYGLRYEPITLTAPDGLKLAAWYVPCAGARAGVVVCHGYHASRQNVASLLPFLHQAGFAAVAFDFRANGASEGRLCSYGSAEKEDVRTAVRYLRAHAGVEPGRVGVLGLSMGGAAAIMAAAEEPDIGAVVSDSGFARLDQMVLQRFSPLGRPGVSLASCTRWWAERMGGFSACTVAPVEAVARISPRPLLLIHGEADTKTPLSQAQALFAAAHEPKQLWTVPHAPHVGCHATARREYERRVAQFFRQALF